jgi:hypothetical protein
LDIIVDGSGIVEVEPAVRPAASDITMVGGSGIVAARPVGRPTASDDNTVGGSSIVSAGPVGWLAESGFMILLSDHSLKEKKASSQTGD